MKLKSYENYLRRFQYQAALDAALRRSDPLVVTSLLEELKYRHGMMRSFQGRNERTLEPLLKFVVKYITDPRFTGLLVNVTNILLDMYTPVLGQSKKIDGLFMTLLQKIDAEIALQQQLLELVGSLDVLLTSSSVTKQQHISKHPETIEQDLEISEE